MQLVRGLNNFSKAYPACVATLGNFDGVHLGHQKILKGLNEQAHCLQLPSCVITFEPHPKNFLKKTNAPVRLTPFREKCLWLKHYGVDQLVCLKFDENLREMSAQSFTETVLYLGLGIKHLIVGHDFRFGCDRTGDLSFLVSAGEKLGWQTSDAGAYSQSAPSDVPKRISSTWIRDCLESGHLKEAETLLGRPFSMTGRVIHGHQLGRTLGFPTANISISQKKLPLQGIFVVSSYLEGVERLGVASLGFRPTVNADGRAHLEVFFPKYSGNLYGQCLTIWFHHKLHDEVQYTSLNELKAAISEDVQQATLFWQQNPRIPSPKFS